MILKSDVCLYVHCRNNSVGFDVWTFMTLPTKKCTSSFAKYTELKMLRKVTFKSVGPV